MKKTIAALLIGWGMVTAAVVWAQEAHATTFKDNQGFLAALDGYGITYPTQQYALDAGNYLCLAESQGHTSDELAKWIDTNNGPLDYRDGRNMVTAAETYLCPAGNSISGGVGAIGGPFKS